MQSLQRAIGPVLPWLIAKQRGLPRYFNGLPCPKGHISERITSTEYCLECKREARRARNRTPEGKAERRASGRRRVRRLYAQDELYRAIYSARTSTAGQLHRIYQGIKLNTRVPSRYTQATPHQLKAHIEAQFQPGMSWGNYAEVWNCDHVRPQTAWDLADPAQFALCWSWFNLQPLTIEENAGKGERWEWPDRLQWAARVRRLGYRGPLLLAATQP